MPENEIIAMPDFQLQQFGKFILAAGLFLAALGLGLILLARTPLFRLPGDLRIEGEHFKLYLPLASSLLLSLILTLLAWLFSGFRR